MSIALLLLGLIGIQQAEPQTADEIMQRVRQATNFALEKIPETGLILEGKGTFNGVPAKLRMHFNRQGHFLLQLDSALGTTLRGYDGKDAWSKGYDGEADLKLGNRRENLLLMAAVYSGLWIDKSSGMTYTLARESPLPDQYLLHFSHEPSQLVGTISINKKSLLPQTCKITAANGRGEMAITWKETISYEGMKLARDIEIALRAEKECSQWESARAATKTDANPFRPQTDAKAPSTQPDEHRRAQLEKLIASLTAAINDGKDNDTTYKLRATAYFLLRRHDEGITDLTEAIRINPKQAEYFCLRGLAWRTKKQTDRAMSDFNDAIRLDPQYSDAYALRGALWLESGKKDDALKDFTKALEIDPINIPALMSRARLYLDRSQFKEAIGDINVAHDSQPKLEDPLSLRSWVFHRLQEYERAIADSTELLKLNPQHPYALRYRASAYSMLKKHELAVGDYSALIQLEPKEAEHYYNRGCSLFSLEKHDRSLKDLRTACELAQWKNPTYSSALSWASARAGHSSGSSTVFQPTTPPIKVPEGLIKGSNPPSGSSTVFQSTTPPIKVRDAKDEREALKEAAWSAYQLGKHQEAAEKCRLAIRACETANVEDHILADSLMLMGIVDRINGRYSQAEASLKRALAIVKKTFGEDHENNATVLTALGNLNLDRGQYQEAEPLFQQALRILEKRSKENQSSLESALCSLGIIHHAQGQYGQAENHYLRALTIFEKAPDREEGNYALHKFNLGSLKVSQGKYQEAMTLYQDALKLLQDRFGKDYLYAGIVLGHLARVHGFLNQHESSDALFEKSQSIKRKNRTQTELAEADQLVKRAQENITRIKLSEAEMTLWNALQSYERGLGPDSEKVAEVYGLLAKLKETQGKDNESAYYQKRAKQISDQIGKEPKK